MTEVSKPHWNRTVSDLPDDHVLAWGDESSEDFTAGDLRGLLEQLEAAQSNMEMWKSEAKAALDTAKVFNAERDELKEQLETAEAKIAQADADFRGIKVKAESMRVDAPMWQLPNEIAHLVAIARSRLSNPATDAGVPPSKGEGRAPLPHTSNPAKRLPDA